MRGVITRNDKILIGALVALAVLSAVPIVTAVAARPPGASAEVSVAGRHVVTLSLARDRTLQVRTRAGVEVLQIAGGKIRVAEAPCPRKICRHQSWISRTGEELVCVPGEMVVRIVGGGESRVDAVSR